MKKLLFILSTVAVLLSSCNDDDDNTPKTLKGDTLSGDITGNVELDSETTYTLDGTLSIKDGATLTIPAGTTIEATKGFSSYIIVEQGGIIEANGTEDAPIVFTSAASSPAAGDWGGIIINGYAPISGGVAGTTEIDATLPYGGDVSDDYSGTLNYVEILYSGAQSSESIEHNGLTLDAVGSKTVISNLYIAYGSDDAVEFFGGTVSITNLLAVNCDDDMFDVTQGWSGTLTNAYGIWEDGYISTEEDPRGVEADGNLDGKYSDAEGQSNFTMTDITIKNASSYIMEDGIKIRRGATATITNALIIGGTTKDLVDVTDSKGFANDNTTISVTNSGVIFTGNEITSEKDLDDDGVNEVCNATVTVADGNTGASTSVFGWTGYNFDEELTATLTGDITDDTYLNSLYSYTLDGTLSVKDGATLTIPAGMTIEATKGFSSYVIVEQGGMIVAEGTADAPIIFTSAESAPAAGDWGGIIINGYAPISGGVSGTTEIDATLPYGGDISDDNSGILKYVEILYSGAQSSESIEHNGLTLDAVGSATVIENLFIAYGSDDAVEFFGGTVNITNLLAVSCDDDMFDVTQGWTGTLDNAYGIWEDGYISTEEDPRGIESDGNLDGKYPDASGQSDFTMKNITIENRSDYEMEDCIKVRRGATATITNAIVIGGTAKDLVDVTDSKGLANDNTTINVTNSGVTLSANEVTREKDIDDDGVNEVCNATVTVAAGNTGASSDAFAWTQYAF